MSGMLPNIKKLNSLIREKTNAIYIVDGAQLVPHRKIDVQDLGIDFICCKILILYTIILYIKIKSIFNQFSTNAHMSAFAISGIISGFILAIRLIQILIRGTADDCEEDNEIY